MRNVKRNQKGFTLLEIIVVLSVLGALSAMLAPVVFRYIDDANASRAQNDVSALAAAINQFYKDTGRYPFYKVGTGKLPYTAATDAAILSSNILCVGTAGSADTTAPVDGGSWGVGAALCDSLTNQLIANTPMSGATPAGTAYATTGPRAWKGPYLERVPATDPWNRSYVVNIDNADPSDTTPEAVYVLSAGANGTIETTATTLATASPAAGGDDIIARVK